MEISAGESGAMRSIDIARQWTKSCSLPSRPQPARTSKRRGEMATLASSFWFALAPTS